MARKRILVTGAFGLIGGAVYRHLLGRPEEYEVHGLARRRSGSDRAVPGPAIEVVEDRFHLVDVVDLAGLEAAVAGMDVVVHMAADPRPEASWESLLSSNVVGTRNVFEAAVRQSVDRVVYASSIMVSWGYQQDEPYRSLAEGRFDEVAPADLHTVTHEWPVRPTGLYPASKVWGEAVARYSCDVHGLSAICLRIGWVNAEDHPHKHESGAVWCSQRDIVQLVEKSIEAPADVKFDVFYGVSNNRWRWVDIEHARQVLGYIPRDSAEEALGQPLPG